MLGAEREKEMTLLFLSSSSSHSQIDTKKEGLVLCPKLDIDKYRYTGNHPETHINTPSTAEPEIN